MSNTQYCDVVDLCYARFVQSGLTTSKSNSGAYIISAGSEEELMGFHNLLQKKLHDTISKQYKEYRKMFNGELLQ